MMDQNPQAMNDIYQTLSKLISKSYPSDDFEIDKTTAFSEEPRPIFIYKALKKIIIPMPCEVSVTTPTMTSKLKLLAENWTDFEILIAFFDLKLNVFYYRVSFCI